MGNKNSSIELVLSYLKYFVTSVNEHGVHSPFVYDLVENLLYDQNEFYCFTRIEKERDRLLNSTKKISRTELGAGSRKHGESEVTIKGIAKNQLTEIKYAQFIFKLIERFKPKHIIELGTSLGITTSYMAKANKNGRVTTIEGDPKVAVIAIDVFKKLGINNIELKVGNFNDLLPQTLNNINGSVGLAYIDGNHKYESTIEYLDLILSKSNEDSIIILDDIRWSKEMEQAWQEAKNRPEVGISIDLFRMGILFLKQDQRKQSFKIRF
ncbi:MAG: O-methyltransferase [Salibacteraceae bacterium]